MVSGYQHPLSCRSRPVFRVECWDNYTESFDGRIYDNISIQSVERFVPGAPPKLLSPSQRRLDACEKVFVCYEYEVRDHLGVVQVDWSTTANGVVIEPFGLMDNLDGRPAACATVTIPNEPLFGTVPITVQARVVTPIRHFPITTISTRIGDISFQCLMSVTPEPPAPVLQPGNFHEIRISVGDIPINLLPMDQSLRLFANILVTTGTGVVSAQNAINTILTLADSGSTVNGNVCVPWDTPTEGCAFVATDVLMEDGSGNSISVGRGFLTDRELPIGQVDLSRTPCVSVFPGTALPTGVIAAGDRIAVEVDVDAAGALCTRSRISLSMGSSARLQCLHT